MDKVVREGSVGASTDGFHELENTGERFLPGAEGTAEQSYDHVARYRLAERYVEGKEIVDLGCGAGYGSHWLSGFARSVIGMDLSEEAVAYATHHYHAPNLRYGVGDVTNLPYRDGTFEAAVSFEVIEHLPKPEDLAREAKRLLREDGLFVVSTPDKQTYHNDRVSSNPHHLKEMYPLEFREMLERHFEHVQIYHQGALAGSIITPDPDELPADGRVSIESAQFSLEDPGFSGAFPTTLYLIAICTDAEPPQPLSAPHLILDRDRQIYEEHLDWDILMRQMDWFHERRHNMLQWRTQQLENQLRGKDAQIRNVQHQIRSPGNKKRSLSGPQQAGGPWRRLSPAEQRLLGVLDAVRRSPAAGPLRKVLSAARRARGVLRGRG